MDLYDFICQAGIHASKFLCVVGIAGTAAVLVVRFTGSQERTV